jgi:hypothetical protein
VEDETITIVAYEIINDKAIVRELEELEIGETSAEYITLGTEHTSGVYYTLMFRTSFKNGEQTVQFFTTKNEIVVSLKKDRSGYYAEVIEE